MKLQRLQPRLTATNLSRVKNAGRPSKATTGYRITGTRLQKIRHQHYKRNPLCVECLKKDPPVIRQWEELDHIIPLHLGGTDTDDNRQGLCGECHQLKTTGEAGGV